MFESMETPEVEAELVGLAGHVAAATCRFLQLLAAFDTRDGWAGPGLRSCAHWLNWRCGMDMRTAREHVRVAHALTSLPAITAAFAAGTISYSKARALSRIATPANEETLLGVALHGTAAQLDTLVRAARAGADRRPAAARRGLRFSHADDGSMLVRLRIPVEQGERFLAAIDSVLADADADADAGSAEPPADSSVAAEVAAEHAPGVVADPLAARRLDALLELVAGERVAQPAALVVHLRVDDLANESASQKPAWIDGGPGIPVSTAERLTCTASVRALLVDRADNPLYLGRTRRTAGPQQLLALRVRDGDRCAFPGCTNRRHLEAHHVRWWRRDGRTDLDNLLLICTFHHTLVHEHGYRVDPLGEGRFGFARPDGTSIPAAGEPLAGSPEHLVAAHTAADVAIDDWTITPRWCGDRLDPDPILRWLVPELRDLWAGAEEVALAA